MNLRQRQLARYGLTLEDFARKELEQDYKCACCHQYESKIFQNGKRRNLSVDHNHTTGEIRGLCCHRCNRVLGFVEENIQILQGIIDYLKKYNRIK